jgi:predicted NAD/FAD-binding protein
MLNMNEKEKVAVDIGFMVFNKITYPNLINFFKKMKLKLKKVICHFQLMLKKLILNIVAKV